MSDVLGPPIKAAPGSEARRFDWQTPSANVRPTAAQMAILSLGTGAVTRPYEYRVAKGWGALQWVKPVIEIMMSVVAETVDFQLRQIFDAVGKSKQYVRIDPGLGAASPDMDDASTQNLNAPREAGQSAVEDPKTDAALDVFVKLLLA